GRYAFEMNDTNAGAFLSVTAGDFDGDGADELAVVSPCDFTNGGWYGGEEHNDKSIDPGCRQKVEFYRYDTDKNKVVYLEKFLYTDVGTALTSALYASASTAHSCNLATIASGNSGTPDTLVMATGVTRSSQASKMYSSYIIFCYNPLQAKESEYGKRSIVSEQLNSTYATNYGAEGMGETSGEYMMFPSVASGDINDDGIPEVVVAGYRLDEPKMAKIDSRKLDKKRFLITYYAYDDNAVLKRQSPMQWVGMEKNDFNGASNIGSGIYNNGSDFAQNPLALTVFAERGDGYAKSVFAGGVVLALPDASKSEMQMGMAGGFDKSPHKEIGMSAGKTGGTPQANEFRLRYAAPVCPRIDNGKDRGTTQNIAMPEAVAGLFTGDLAGGREQVAFTYIRKHTGSSSYDADLCFLYLTGDAGDTVANGKDGELPTQVAFWNKVMYNKTSLLPITIAAPDVDDDSSIIMYDKTKQPSFYFTDPQITAVLQAAPYFSEIAKAGYIDGANTEMSKTSGSENSMDNAISVSAGVYGGLHIEASGGAPVAQMSLGEVEFRISLSASVGWANEQQYVHSVGATYSSGAEDSVVLSMAPYVRYYYKQWIPGDDMWVDTYIDRPGNPRLTQISVDDYDRVAEENGWKTIRDNVFGGSVAGDPDSYSSLSPDTWNAFDEFKSDSGGGMGGWITAGSGTGARSLTISHEKHSANGVPWGVSLAVEAHGRVGPVFAGLSGSYDYTGGYMWGSFNATEYTGTVPNIPSENTAAYGFEWEFGTYFTDLLDDSEPLQEYLKDTDQDGATKAVKEKGLDTLVLGYRVRNVKAAPRAPEVNVESSTQDTVTLAWSPSRSKSVAYYEVARVVGDFYHSLGMVENGDTEGGVYRFIDTQCSPGEIYQYAVRSQGYSNGWLYSGQWSGSVYAVTQSAGGENAATVTKQPEDVTVRAGQTARFEVGVSLPQGAGNPTYQWQTRKNNRWEGVTGTNASSAVLTLTGVTPTMAREYRCSISVMVSGKVTPLYSDAAKLTVGKGPTKTELKMSADSGLAEKVTITYEPGKTTYKPTVVFEISGKQYPVFILSIGGADRVVLN
ncbi:MAG: immunoglobulin domain-containing protein, partial [Clostridiales Family XIII bacterium]|nr:immunoglobulin domain-containing protein [Clostridiales Family XIII bacterium]